MAKTVIRHENEAKYNCCEVWAKINRNFVVQFMLGEITDVLLVNVKISPHLK